ncbi:MAG: DUF4340 domain-containing protein [Candidatus Cloacimonetes bacterium]|nr:DUF4340 domain-containing protein [Candidatus Cloacimonadota bacterium]
MNKKTRLYILILVVLVVIYMVSKIDTNKEKKFNFFTADSNSVARFEITSITDTLHLAKVAGEWKIVAPVTWALQDGKVDKLLDTVLPAETSSIPVSENAASLEKYDLTDSMATHFKTLDSSGNVLDDVLVGKSDNYNVTPVRKMGSNSVYLLESNISYTIKPVLDSWRRREIVDIDPDQIVKFMVVSDDATYTLTLSDSLWEYADEKESFSVKDDNATLKSLKSTFNRFAATGFVDGEFDQYADALAIPVLELGLEMWDGSNYYFRYAPYEEKKYVVQLNSDTETLYLQSESSMKKFQKTSADFK